MSFFLILDVDIRHFCQSVHEHCDLGSELTPELIESYPVGAVLDRIVEKRRAD